MKFETILDIEKLKEVTVIANSASFLHRSFMQNQSILELFSAFTDQELINKFYEKINEPRTLTNIAELYAIIISLSLYNTSYSTSFFDRLISDNSLKWNYDLSNIYLNKISFDIIEKKPEIVYSIIENSDLFDEDTVLINL